MIHHILFEVRKHPPSSPLPSPPFGIWILFVVVIVIVVGSNNSEGFATCLRTPAFLMGSISTTTATIYLYLYLYLYLYYIYIDR